MVPDHVYHLVEACNWPSVQRHGLLSTRELLRLTGVPPAAREDIATTQRLRLTVLSDQVGISRPVAYAAERVGKVSGRDDSAPVVCSVEPNGLFLV
jgi:hypothetical protein